MSLKFKASKLGLPTEHSFAFKLNDSTDINKSNSLTQESKNRNSFPLESVKMISNCMKCEVYPSKGYLIYQNVAIVCNNISSCCKAYI